jgi:hypothetical protein
MTDLEIESDPPLQIVFHTKNAVTEVLQINSSDDQFVLCQPNRSKLETNSGLEISVVSTDEMFQRLVQFDRASPSLEEHYRSYRTYLATIFFGVIGTFFVVGSALSLAHDRTVNTGVVVQMLAIVLGAFALTLCVAGIRAVQYLRRFVSTVL